MRDTINIIVSNLKTPKVLFFVLVFFFFCTKTSFANESHSGEIPWGFLVIGLFGGLALFLYGIEKMSEGMKKSAGNKLRAILATLTRNRLVALLVGAFVTMVIQSSSATTVMLVSFVQAELMSFIESLGVILGADIGTTFTAQLIASRFTDYALLIIVIGFAMRLFAKKDEITHIGEAILGFGILFFGMKLMSDAMSPLRTHPEIINLMRGLENPLLGLLAGALFTALIQSSAAFAGIVIVLAQQGMITLEAGIPLVFGANIGTCITAGLACIGTSREAKRVALAHVLFKIAGVILFVFWIPTFADFVTMITAYLGGDAARQIANAHTFFNVGLGLGFLPFTTIFAAFIIKIFPDREEIPEIKPITWHLDESMISTPDFAIGLARTEISLMAKLLLRMLRAVIVPFISDTHLMRRGEDFSKSELKLLIKEVPTRDEIYPQLTLIEGIEMREKKIDFLDEKVGNYLIQIARQELTSDQANEVYGMVSITNDMESIGDIIHRNMIPLIKKKQALKTDFSQEGKEELMIYHVKVCKQIKRLEEAFQESDLKRAQKIMEKEVKYSDLESKYRLQHLERLLHNREESVETHEIHMKLMDHLKQVSVYTANIAKTFLSTSRQNHDKHAKRSVEM